MADQDDVRRLAMALPGALAASEGFAFSVEHKGKEKGFAWVWQERVEPKKPRIPNPLVLAVRVAGEVAKSALLSADEDKFFTEPHYNGFPAVLVRLPNVTDAELQHLLIEAWRCMAPRELVAAYDAAPVRATPAPARRAAAATKRPAAAAAKHPAAAAKRTTAAAKRAAAAAKRPAAAAAKRPRRSGG